LLTLNIWCTELHLWKRFNFILVPKICIMLESTFLKTGFSFSYLQELCNYVGSFLKPKSFGIITSQKHSSVCLLPACKTHLDKPYGTDTIATRTCGVCFRSADVSSAEKLEWSYCIRQSLESDIQFSSIL
jgi:hypothetical protein